MVTPAEGPSFGNRAGRHVDVHARFDEWPRMIPSAAACDQT